MNRNAIASVWVPLFLLAVALPAVKVRQVEKSTFKDFEKGTFQNVIVESSGKLSLGPTIRKITGPAEEYYFSFDFGRNGEWFVGTGHNGGVYRVDAAGKSELWFKTEQPDVFALSVARSGDLLVGSSPNGKVYRIGKDKKATELFDPEEKFIWDVREDREGNVICAVGNTGGVYSISKTGQVENIFSAEDSHIVSLYIARDNSIFAGSGDRGILYQIKNRKVRVMFDAPLEEIKSIGEDDEGNIYFAAIRNQAPARNPKEAEIETLFKRSESGGKPAVREKSFLFCLKTDGTVEKLWSSTEEYIYSLSCEAKSGSVIIGTGNSGKIYRIQKNGTYALIYEGDSAQVYKVAGDEKGFVSLGNNAASLARVDNGMTSSGTYFSDVFDARIQSKFGRLTWVADLPKQTNVTLAVRYGNSDNPDKSWTSWSAPFMDPENSSINALGYRFLQTKVVLNTSNPLESPSLDAFRIYYLEANLKPDVRDITIQRGEDSEKKPAAKDALPAPKKYLAIGWEADDPNLDQLNFNVFVRKLGGGEWVQARKNLLEKTMKLDTEMFADGRYQLKVEADDSLDNPLATAKTAVLVSSPFTIDSTAPYLKDLTIVGTAVSFTAYDDASAISQVLYSLDGKEWHPVFPDDGIADSRSEKFSFVLGQPREGKILFIKLIDEFLNYKVFQKEF